MKRVYVVRRLRDAARTAGLACEVEEWTNHTSIRIGAKVSTLGRHSEVDEKTVVKFYKQYEDVLGKGWWR